MALFDRLSQRNVLSLLRVGFGARLRSEVADIFLTADADETLKRTDKRAEATVFFFLSGDTNVKPSVSSDTLPQSALCTVLAAGPSSASHPDPFFLNLSDDPTLSANPAVLKVSLHSAPNSRRILFSFASAGPNPKCISFRDVACGAAARCTENVCKFATFHFEVLMNTIGKGFVPDDSHATQLSYVTPAQALTHALLQLNVRFRLCSVHKSVLASSSTSSTGSSQRLTLVQQNAPSSSDITPVVLSAFSLVQPVPDSLPSSRFYSLVIAGSSPAVSLHIPNPSSSDRDPVLQQSAVKKPSVCVNALSDGWGALNLGTCETGSVLASDESKTPNDASEKNIRYAWLTGGPRGKVETRPHRRNWETFSIEYVEQSLTAAWNDLPIPQLYSIADRQTRATVRATIQRNLANSSASHAPDSDTGAKSTNRAGRNGAFNHAAALAGLSDVVDTASQAKASPVQTQDAVASRTKAKGKKAKPKSGNSAIVAKTEAERSALPRNVANRKAAKKNKKKSKESSRAATSSSVTTSAVNDAADSSNEPSPSDVSDSAGQSSQNTENSSSSESSKSPDSKPAATESLAGSGPCAACGRAIVGTSTTAMGKAFHPQCFCCGRCRKAIRPQSGQFRERGGIPYCQSCYASHLAARCARCSEPILETVITAMDKTWHKDCLTCSLCRLPLTQTFWLYADRPNEPRCSRCVTGEEYSSVGRTNGRMVNLPGFGRNNYNRPPFSGVGGSDVSPTLGDIPSDRGRARLYPPASLAPFRR